jgi:formylglycine-generating enzyme required for sulfatase activity
MKIILFFILACSISMSHSRQIAHQNRVHDLLWDIHEMSVGQVSQFSKATGFVSRAEKDGGGFIYEAGWMQKKYWSWRKPFGVTAKDDEPAVHLTFEEAQSICRFFKKRLPTDAEWVAAAYHEQRQNPPDGFKTGQQYLYPNGESAKQSHCLQGCSNFNGAAPQGSLNRGTGHVPVLLGGAGVNGLYHMGGNVWEWVDTPIGSERITRGGSWWYDASRQMQSDVASKPPDTRVAYIGFRCVQP